MNQYRSSQGNRAPESSNGSASASVAMGLRLARWRVFSALMPSLLAFAAMFWILGERPSGAEFVRSALWGLVLLTSSVGWGKISAKIVVPRWNPDWGMSSAVGLAALLALGGALQVVRLVSPVTVIILTSVGLAALGASRLARQAAPVATAAYTPQTPMMTGAILVLYVLALAVYLANFATTVINPWDDAEAYLVYPKALLATGALEEPFSFRRLGALGGQSLLQSFLLVGATPARLNGFDNGICLLSIFGLVHGYPRGSTISKLLAMLFVVAFSYPFHNLASALSGTVFFLALFRVLDEQSQGDLTSPRCAILIGLLAAGAWTLRQNYMIALLPFIGAAYGFRWLDETSAARRQVVSGLLWMMGALVLFLIPWWIVNYRSSSTFMFPLMLGNARADFGILARVPLKDELQYFIFSALWNRPVRGIWLFVLAGLCLVGARRERALLALLIGAGVGAIVLTHELSAFDDVMSVSRYYMAFECAYVLATILKAPFEPVVRKATLLRSSGSAVLVSMGVGFQIWDGWDEMVDRRVSGARRAVAAIATPRPRGPTPKDLLYRRLQAEIPPGATILEILDEPFRLDFHRNKILVCDLPGGAAPTPGWPIHLGADAYEEYLRGQGIRYLAFVLGSDSPEYDRARWSAFLAEKGEPKRNGHLRGTLLREMAVFYLDIFDALTELALRKRHLFHEGSIHVLDLDTPASAP